MSMSASEGKADIPDTAHHCPLMTLTGLLLTKQGCPQCRLALSTFDSHNNTLARGLQWLHIYSLQ